MEEKFTVEQFRNYCLSQDSMGDILYFLNADNIRAANEMEDDIFSKHKGSSFFPKEQEDNSDDD